MFPCAEPQGDGEGHPASGLWKAGPHADGALCRARAAGKGSMAGKCSQGEVTLEQLGGPQSVKACVNCVMCG